MDASQGVSGPSGPSSSDLDSVPKFAGIPNEAVNDASGPVDDDGVVEDDDDDGVSEGEFKLDDDNDKR